MDQLVRRSDLRRLFIRESTRGETEDDVGAVAMAEVASLFPYVIVTGVHQVERRRGGWFVEVVTKEREKRQRKVTMPTHRDSKTRVTEALEPLDDLEKQIDEIKRRSRKVLGEPDALLVLVGEPTSEPEAVTMLDALRRVERGSEPSSDEEAAVVALIAEYLSEPTEAGHMPADRPAEDRPDDDAHNGSTSMQEAPQTKRCNKCGEDREITEFSRDRRSKDGRASTCKPCRKAAYRDYYQSRKASDTPPTADAPQIQNVNGAGTPEPNQDWRQHFADPTLRQLEHLRAFFGDATFDETVRITRAIAGKEVSQ